MRLILASGSPRRRELLNAAGYEFDVVRPNDEAETGLCSNCGPAELVAKLAVAKATDVVRRLRVVGSGQWAVGSDEGVGDRGQGAGNSGQGAGVGDQMQGDGKEVAASQRPAGRSTVSFEPISSDSTAPDTTPHSEIHTPKSLLVLAADTVAECDGQILGKPRDEDHARRMLEMLSGRKHRVYTGVCLWPVTGTECQVPSTQYASSVAVTTLRMDRLTESQLDEYLASGGWEGKAGAFGYQDRLGWVHVTEGSESNVVGLPMEMMKAMLRDAGYDASKRRSTQ